MSSFINSSKHFASVKKSIITLRYREKDIMKFKIARLLPELSVLNSRNQEMAEEKINEIIDTIIDIQVICVCLQYKHHYIGTLDKKIYETQEHIKGNLETGEILSKIALFKAIQQSNPLIFATIKKQSPEKSPFPKSFILYVPLRRS